MTGKIYKIINTVNGKIYIGQTTKSLKERFQKHCWSTTDKDKYHKEMAIKKAIKKYGKVKFTIELIEKMRPELLDSREKYWIAYYNSYSKGYNCTKGGQNGATRSTKLTLEEEDKVIQMKLEGYSIDELSTVFSIDKTTVKNIFKRHNLYMPNRRNLNDRIDIKEFIEFLKGKPTVADIQKHFNISYSSVYNYLRRNNIEYNFPKSVQTLPSKVEG